MSNIPGALFYLWRTSFVNGLKSRLTRLKQPKYMLGAVVGAAYVYLVLIRRTQGNRGGRVAADLAASQPELAVVVGALMLLLVCVLCWIWSRERAALDFTEAEIAFLFPAPIRRRTLIHYRLWRLQVGYLFTALVLAAISSSWTSIPGNFAIRFLGWWLIFSIWSLQIIGSAFVITRWLDRGLTQPRRQLMMTALFAAAIAIALWAAWGDLRAPTDSDLATVSAIVAYFAKQFVEGPLAWLLLPAKLVVRPLFTSNLQSFLIALWPAAIVFAVHYFWVLQTEVSFEEASIARAAKRARKLAAFREGKYGVVTAKARRAPFNLSAAKRPEFAFLWKNLLSSAEYLRPRTAIVTATIIVVGCTWLKNQSSIGYQELRSSLGVMSMVVAVYLVIFGPQLARQDLRSDLLNTDILKAYPLRGWQVVLGEILTPTAIVTVLMWLVLLTATLTVDPGKRTAWLTPQTRLPIALALATAMPLLCMMQILVVNAATILFPAWSQSGRRGPPSIETMGQSIFFMVGQLFVMLVTLIPAAIVAGVVHFVAQWMVGPTSAIVIAALSAIAVLVVEVCVGVELLGKAFDKFDLSAELRP